MFNFIDKTFAYLGSCPEIYLNPSGKNYIVVTSVTVEEGLFFTHIGFGCKIVKEKPKSIDLYELHEFPRIEMKAVNEPTYIADITGIWWSKSCEKQVLKSLSKLYHEQTLPNAISKITENAVIAI